MNRLYEIIPASVVKAIGSTLLHSLWQGIAIALVLALLLVCMRRSSAAARYLIATGSLVTFAVISLVTFINAYSTQPTSALKNTIALMPSATGNAAEVTNPTLQLKAPEGWGWQELYADFYSYFQEHLPLIVLLWCMGITGLMIRFIGGFAYTQRLKSYKTIVLPPVWQQTVNRLASNAKVKQAVNIAESALVKVPMVVGYIKPVILLPVGTIIGLPANQIEAILAHEMAHIYRKDYLVNILQCLAEIIFFYHPAIWWISARIREEREHCCDDMAISLCGDRLTFAKALASLENFYAGTPALTMGFAGNGHQLLSRIKRLVQEPKRTPSFAEGFLAACILMISITAISVSAGTGLHTGRVNNSAIIAGGIVSPLAAEAMQELLADTTQQTFTFKGTRNGKKYDIKAIMQKGTIINLFVNGKKIPDSQKSTYYDLIYDLMGAVPAPPSPALAPGLIDPGFPVDPVAVPDVPDIPAIVPQEPEDMHAVLSPAGVPDKIVINPEPPHPPVPSINPMTPEDIAAIVQAAFRGDTSFMAKGDFVHLFLGKKGQTYKITIKDGVLTDLSVDGKKVDKNDFSNYAYLGEELEEDARMQIIEHRARQEEMAAQQKRLLEQQERIEQEHIRLSTEMQQKLQKSKEEALIRHEKAMKEHEESARLSKKLIDLLNTQLLKDKLIEKHKSHYIQISPDGLFIDKKKQPEQVFEKYKKLLENTAEKPLDFTIQYTYN